MGRTGSSRKSNEASPSFSLPDGNYIVHCAMGLAGMTQRVMMAGAPTSERLLLNAGGLRIVPVLGDQPINPAKLTISIYVPEHNNAEAKTYSLQSPGAGDVIGLPEGNYHIVSTLLDTTGFGTMAQNGIANATNSVVNADLRVQPGKLTDATLRHRAAVMTLKLVNAPGGEALANSAFTILTPGGDVIRELIGAFPSLVLAEGEYVAIAPPRRQDLSSDLQSRIDARPRRRKSSRSKASDRELRSGFRIDSMRPRWPGGLIAVPPLL